jgi:hypothetical protein
VELADVIPWGRSRQEYIDMFNLTEAELQQPILSVADGPASFNAEQAHLGNPVLSVDPLYQFDAEQIEQRIQAVYPIVMEQVSTHQSDFIWSHFNSVEDLGQQRLHSMRQFLTHFASSSERYRNIALPDLSRLSQHFHLALCSHFLFLYSTHLDLDFHLRAVTRLCELADEVRIYPLVTLENKSSPHIEAVLTHLAHLGHQPALVPVQYQFQRGATHMLHIRVNND